MLTLAFLTHFATTWFMTGLIWMVQIVHYPLFADIGRDDFVPYERKHSRAITFIVAPAMLLESASAAGLTWLLIETQLIFVLVNIALLIVIWGSTFLIQVPIHQKLELGFDETLHKRLVSTNWIRTICWTARALLMAILAGSSLLCEVLNT
ncbi:hypothetical protein SH449x_001353 [Pirellulaceae bacterium SH449]